MLVKCFKLSYGNVEKEMANQEIIIFTPCEGKREEKIV